MIRKKIYKHREIPVTRCQQLLMDTSSLVDLIFATNPDLAPFWLQSFNIPDVSSCENDFLSAPVLATFPLKAEHACADVYACVTSVFR